MLNQHIPPPMILRKLRAPVVSLRQHHDHHLQFAPRLNITVLQGRAKTVVQTERVLEGSAAERVLRREEFVHRIFEQGARREDGARTERSAVSREPSPILARHAVPAVLLRSAAPPAFTPEPPAAASPSSAWSVRMVPSASPPFDMQRLSDQVIQTIDRRLQAHRERLGKR